jgi:hypothetical protein
MKNLEQILIEYATQKCSRITAADIRSAANDCFLPISEADFGIRIIKRSKTDLLLNSIANSKKEYYAVLNGEIFHTSKFTPTSMRLDQDCFDIFDEEAEKPAIEEINRYEKACDRFHEMNPEDTRVDYDCFSWFKGSNTVILAPNYKELRGQLPKSAKRIIRDYSEILN